ncbi:hypothetical protein MMC21_006056 [Puttea exsequens]|nr:hypothetical protein [Puttea exsequens]
MSILTNPKSLFVARIIQIGFAIVFLVLVCYSGVHRGWWNNINGPLAVGVIATIFTLALAIFSVVTSRKQNPFSGGTRTRTVMLLAGEIVVFLLWVASAVLMLRSKGGCADWVTMEGTAYCPDKKKRDDVPNIQWFISVAFAFVEIVSFVLTALLVFKGDRETKVTGGASYA